MKAIALSLLLLANPAQLVHFGPPDPHYCDSEVVSQNLQLKTAQTLQGILRDPNGAPFKATKVEIKWKDDKGPRSVTNTTDAEGRFQFPALPAGHYRLLMAPSRGWQQPQPIVCREAEIECHREIVLQPNATDMPYSQCPLK